MSMIIQHNMAMLNASRQLNTNTKKKVQSAEKLSSGYRINKAADDAAGLSISEKMRWMIRGLNKGTENAQDGVSWVQIGDGSLEETHAMLHRMTELAIKASNETCTDSDRMMMQAEFNQLQKEIDRLTDNTYFNEKHIFNEHESPMYQIKGETQWPENMIHTVRAGENDLVIAYRQKVTDQPKTSTITVPPGDYTTRELIDEIDTALSDSGLLAEGVMFEYTQTGLCNLNLEGGEKIDEVSGGLSYLLYDQYGGGSLGALIGTTIFWSDKSTLDIVQGENDKMSFQLISAENENDRTLVDITLGDGRKTKAELMEAIDLAVKDALKDKQIDPQNPDKVVTVEPHGTGIMLSSPDYIISEFKGPMFEVDSDAITSVFYDNIHHAAVTSTSAWFQGAGVLQDPNYRPQGVKGSVPDNEVFHIQKGKNDVLVLQANGEAQPIIIDDLASQDGKNIYDMCGFLEGKLQGHGLQVSVEQMGTGYQKDINGNSNPVRYLGLRITSTERGPGSRIEFDMSKSTAYATLFTSQPTISYVNDAVFDNAKTPDQNACLKSLKPLTGGLVVNSTGPNKNDAFTVSLTDRSGTVTTLPVTIDAIKYTSAEQLAAEIQTKLRTEMKNAGLDETKVTVKAEAGQIVIEGDPSYITQIGVGKVPDNKGCEDIFMGDKIVPNHKVGTGVNAKVELPIAAQVDAGGKVTIPQGQRELRVRVDNEGANNDEGVVRWHRMTLKESYDSIQALEEHINKELGEKTTAIQFSPVDKLGTTDTTTVSGTKGEGRPSLSGMGSYAGKGEIVLKKEDNPTGQGTGSEVERVDPAKVIFGNAITEPVEINYRNKSFSFTLNEDADKKEVNIDLSTELEGGKTKFDTAQDFCDALQKAITAKLGGQDPSKVGGVKVTQENGVITLTAGILKENGEWNTSKATNITMGKGSGSFIYDLHNTGTTVTATVQGTGKGLNGSFKVKADTSFTLQITKPDASGTPQTTPVTLTLKASENPYNTNKLVGELNKQLTGTGVTADFEYNYSTRNTCLTFKMSGKDSNYKLEIPDTNSDAMKYLFGYDQEDGTGNYELSLKKPAVATLDKQVQKNVTFESSDDRHFLVEVDGNPYNIELDATTYAQPDDIANAIKDKVNAMSKAAGRGDVLDNAWIEDGQLYLRTKSKNGANSRIKVTYKEDSAMKKIFGYTSRAGVNAKVDPATNKLTLTRVGGEQIAASQRSVYVVSELTDDEGRSAGYVGGSFIVSDPPEELLPESENGVYSGIHSSMDGVDLKFNANGKVDINEFNNKLSFWYSDDYDELNAKTPRSVTATLAKGEYTMTDLETALQNAIDKDKKTFGVTVTEAGVHIETVNSGRKYRIYTNTDYSYYRPSGGFYEQIMCSAEKSTVGKPVQPPRQGGHNGNEVYAVGRQDVKNNTVKIQKDGNDSLSLQLTVPGRTDAYTLKMILEPNYYQGDSLVKQIQEKLDEALVKEGLPKGMIEVGIGLVDTKIFGAIDDRALTFRLSDKVPIPQESANNKDWYGIEAIGGTAAFSVFYQTEGDITRAYIKGGKDVAKGIEIKEGANDFSVDVDGTTYKIELPPKFYSAEELITEINQKFQSDANGNKVPLTAKLDEGKVKLMHVKLGKHKITNLKGAVKNQLFFTEKGEERDDSIHLRLSSVSGDWTEIDRPWMNTMSLGINSLTLSKYKYAQKAITRLKEAVTKTSDVRSYFGATQNRLESTIRNNENKAENTQAAESRIRDADISREAVENSIHNILEQTGGSVLAQAKQNSNLALQLLS